MQKLQPYPDLPSSPLPVYDPSLLSARTKETLCVYWGLRGCGLLGAELTRVAPMKISIISEGL